MFTPQRERPKSRHVGQAPLMARSMAEHSRLRKGDVLRTASRRPIALAAAVAIVEDGDEADCAGGGPWIEEATDRNRVARGQYHWRNIEPLCAIAAQLCEGI